MIMASKTKLQFIDKGFRDILSSEGTKSCIESVTSSIQTKAGPDFEGEVSYYGQGHRWMGFVHTTDHESMKEESENKTLTKAVR
jgi:hypothetical protein